MHVELCRSCQHDITEENNIHGLCEKCAEEQGYFDEPSDDGDVYGNDMDYDEPPEFFQ